MIKLVKRERGLGMRNVIVSAILAIAVFADVGAAQQPVQRGRSATQAPSVGRGTIATRGASVGTTTARSATPSVPSVTARSGIQQPKTVTARAATTQKVINSGTKIAAATKNTAVDEECQEKYFGCMDSFCMLDNANGGRCLCSDINAKYDALLENIDKVNEEAYLKGTLGVEKIKLGDNAEEVFRLVNAASTTSEDTVKSIRKTFLQEDDDDVFALDTEQTSIDGLTGDALRVSVNELCFAQIPECSANQNMLQLLYAQRIKSDCSAYENSLKSRLATAKSNLYEAEESMRQVAAEQTKDANKYNLGQCTTEFTKCMQSTGECGEDFSKCATIVSFDNTNKQQSGTKKAQHTIKHTLADGSKSKNDVYIEIAESTYQTLLMKKPLCEHVTNSCVRVKDLVWDTFVEQVAPILKSAELIAEDNLRQNCIGEISKCFQKACKDNIDPNDPEGSYDLCLTHPETMLKLCKIPLNACGIDTSSEKKAEESSKIWEDTVARLKSMRVDSCTKGIKSCLQSEDRCGSDYSQCIGLDRDTIMELCPRDKLVGCDKTKTLDEIQNIVEGIFLNIDNTMLSQCQNVVKTKMMEICGDTESCPVFDNDTDMGTESLMSYRDNNGNYIIEGLVSFGNVNKKKTEEIQEDAETVTDKFVKYELDVSEYKEHLNESSSTAQNNIISALQSTANKINQKIDMLVQDPQIKMCIEGRDMSQIRRGNRTTTARYPHLLDSTMSSIIDAGLNRAEKNYTTKYLELLGNALKSQDDDAKSATCASMVNGAKPVCAEYDDDGMCTKYETTDFGDMYAESGEQGIISGNVYTTRHIIQGTGLTRAQMPSVARYIQEDSNGNMLGRVSVTSSYSSTTHVCTVTTETSLCDNAKKKGKGDIQTIPENDRGMKCNVGVPTVSTTTIEM